MFETILPEEIEQRSFAIIEEELGDQFIRTHRSYLIAVDKIESIDLKHNQVMVGGEVCLVSKKEKSRLLARINRS